MVAFIREREKKSEKDVARRSDNSEKTLPYFRGILVCTMLKFGDNITKKLRVFHPMVIVIPHLITS